MLLEAMWRYRTVILDLSHEVFQCLWYFRPSFEFIFSHRHLQYLVHYLWDLHQEVGYYNGQKCRWELKRELTNGALAFSFNALNCGHHEQEPEEEGGEEQHIEHYPVGDPPRPDLHIDKLLHPFSRKHSDMSQARRYVKLHFPGSPS
ncbi:hypothetical protein SAY87_005088 [Trapa incisa]|uniref:Uncharacterized protein n=1 Tax=Trapa incisa TaxID=236973 RepID=A0AAN7PNT7_9MYRT|nr:hypothetical protein SAY87_005088 [Trapa incisa]